MATLLFVSLLVIASSALADLDSSITTQLLWPIPSSVQVGVDVFSVDPSEFNFTLKGNGTGSDTLKQAIQRYTNLIFKTPAPFYPSGANASSTTMALTELTVFVFSSNETLNQDTDESYSLTVSDGILFANTVYGALRGLETFSQLVFRSEDGTFMISDVTIYDKPRFKFRGSMIDTSRHFLDMPTILDHLDAMSYNKFNVLHWHIVDDPSFPYTSIKFPDLSTMGAFDKNHIFSQADVQQVIEYARARGIRVIPEFDSPGHSQSWGKGQPGLLTPCYTNGQADGTFGPINPILPSTWTFLEALYGELVSVFKDDYLHLGGDEVSFNCWESNPDLQKWMMEHNYTDYSKLEQYYETKLLELVASLNKQYIVWQEIFDNGLQVLPDTVIEVWKGGWQPEMYNVTKSGLTAILSSCWYLNYIHYGSDWTSDYLCDPHDFNGTESQNDLVIGGEQCMWGEYVDTANFISRTWPRASAVGERLWSPKTYNSTAEAEPRLRFQRCRMISRGIQAEPVNGPGYCSYEWPGTDA